jgi:hypothetical protein
MAKTHTIRSLGAGIPQHPLLGYAAQWEPEGATETFTAGSPVVWASGLLVAGTDPIASDQNSVTGLAIEDAHNAAAGITNLCKFIPAVDGIIFYGNLLTGDGATFAFSEADLGAEGGAALAAKSGLITSGVTDWFLDDADALGATIVSTMPDIILPGEAYPRVEDGDSDVRVGFIFIHTCRQYGYKITYTP